MSGTKPKTINDYIDTFPENIREKLEQVRQTIHKTIPEADEDIKWSMPAFVDETILVMFSGTKNHIGFYITPSTLDAFEDELSEYNTGKGSIRFPYDKPLPTGLISKLTKYRAWESREKGINWKS